MLAIAAEQPLAGLPASRRLRRIAVVVIILLYATNIHDKWWPTKDGSQYFSLARSIAAGEGYLHNGQPDNTFPPGLPLLLAGISLTIGENYWVLNGMMGLFALATLALMHACLKRITDAQMAMLLTLLAALSYRFFENASRILTDMPMAMLAWLAIYAGLRQARGSRLWLGVIAAASVLAVLFRMPGLLIMGAIAAGVLLDSRLFGSIGRRLAAASAALLPAMATAAVLYLLAKQIAAGEARYESMVSNIAYGQQFASAAAYLPTSMGALMTAQRFWIYGVLFLALGAVGLAASVSRRHWLTPAMCLLYPLGLLLVTRYDNALRDRFLFVIQPLLMLLAMQGAAVVCLSLARLRGANLLAAIRKAVPAVVLAIALITVGVNIPRLAFGVYLKAYAAHSDLFYRQVEDGDYADLLAAADVIAARTPPDAKFLMHEYLISVAHYRSGRLAEMMPDEAVASSQGLYRYLAERPALAAVILPRRTKAGRYPPELSGALDESPAWTKAFESKAYAVYIRSDE